MKTSSSSSSVVAMFVPVSPLNITKSRFPNNFWFSTSASIAMFSLSPLVKQSSVTFWARFFDVVVVDPTFAPLTLEKPFLPVGFIPKVEIDVGSRNPPVRASSIALLNSCVVADFTPDDSNAALSPRPSKATNAFSSSTVNEK